MMNYQSFKKNIISDEIEKNLINLVSESINFINSQKINRLDNKNDGTCLSKADLEIDNIIFETLSKLDSTIPVISEERSFNNKLFMSPEYWLIDPIDGTRNYINGGNEFTINIALISKGNPIFGIIGHPPSNNIWIGKKNHVFIYNNKTRLKKKIVKLTQAKNKNTVIISNEKNKNIENLISKIENIEIIKVSSSLKFCYLATNKAIFYPRFSIIKKWDIAAGHAILNSSGGVLTNLKGKTYNYNYPSSCAKAFFAYSNLGWDKRLLLNN